jgi:hypothetical protein
MFRYPKIAYPGSDPDGRPAFGERFASLYAPLAARSPAVYVAEK